MWSVEFKQHKLIGKKQRGEVVAIVIRALPASIGVAPTDKRDVLLFRRIYVTSYSGAMNLQCVAAMRAPERGLLGTSGVILLPRNWLGLESHDAEIYGTLGTDAGTHSCFSLWS
jgi:hypothetical protein